MMEGCSFQNSGPLFRGINVVDVIVHCTTGKGSFKIYESWMWKAIRNRDRPRPTEIGVFDVIEYMGKRLVFTGKNHRQM